MGRVPLPVVEALLALSVFPGTDAQHLGAVGPGQLAGVAHLQVERRPDAGGGDLGADRRRRRAVRIVLHRIVHDRLSCKTHVLLDLQRA